MEADMRPKLAILAALTALAGPAALAQSNGPPPGSAPAPPGPGQASAPDRFVQPPDAMVGGYAVSVAPDPAATSMSDPGSAAEYGSPSVTDSPSSPMAFQAGWPPIRQTPKRPKWVKTAPSEPKAAEPPPRGDTPPPN
jgi:hypothetical protein